MGREGSGVRAVSQSTIEISFTFKGVRCRERLKIQPTPANLKRAERHRAATMDAIGRGNFDYAFTFPDSPRARAFADTPGDLDAAEYYLSCWLQEKKVHLSASTYKDYSNIISHVLIPAFGHLPFSAIGRKEAEVSEWAQSKTCSNKRIANILSPLTSALNDAVNNGLIDYNPLKGWYYQRKEAPKDDYIHPFSREEQEAILQTASGQGKNLIQFAFWTGLRTSEMVALRWHDIDFSNGIVQVRRGRTQAAREDETTKTPAGRRNVKLLGPAREALELQKAWTFEEGQEGNHVFLNPGTGKPWQGDQPIRRTLWMPLLKKAGVAYRNPYQTRHTYASMMLSSGENPMWVAQQMGHKDWSMITRVYGKWMPDANPDSGGKAVSLYCGHVLKD